MQKHIKGPYSEILQKHKGQSRPLKVVPLDRLDILSYSNLVLKT